MTRWVLTVVEAVAVATAEVATIIATEARRQLRKRRSADRLRDTVVRDIERL